MSFDVEEYRADLERRKRALEDLEVKHHRAWLAKRGVWLRNGNRLYADVESIADSDYQNAERCRAKARGLEIALSLLPKSPNPEPGTLEYAEEQARKIGEIE